MADKIPEVRLHQAAQLLGGGVKQSEVAERTGISPSYLNELIHGDTGFQKLVMEHTNVSPIHQRIDNRIDQIEEAVWNSIHTNISAFAKPHLALALARTVNAAKRRSEGEGKPVPETVVNVVNIELPTFAAEQMKDITVKKNASNEVIEVGGRPMITAPADSLIKQAQQELDGKAEKSYQQISQSPQVPENLNSGTIPQLNTPQLNIVEEEDEEDAINSWVAENGGAIEL